MHTNPDNDLNDLERRLSAWQPAAEGLSPDAMLYAAGRASIQLGRGRLAWPLLSASLALLAVGLGVWLTAERAERLALAQQLRPRPPAPPSLSPEEGPATEALPPASYLALRRTLEQDITAWPPHLTSGPEPPPGPPTQSSPVLRAWPSSAFFDR